jgi:two-component system cell cycle sensor histidine kinase/response regulator CckA
MVDKAKAGGDGSSGTTPPIAASYGRVTKRAATSNVDASARRLLWKVIERSANEVYVFNGDDWRFEYANQAACHNLRYTLDALRKLTPLRIAPGHTRESFAEILQPLIGGAKTRVSFRTVHQRADGSTYPVDVHLQMTRHSKRRVFMALATDSSAAAQTEATQRLEADRSGLERQLYQAQKMESIGRLAGGIAHEFNNITASLVLLAASIKENAAEGRTSLEAGPKLERIAESTGTLTSQLLAFACKRAIAPRTFCLEKTINDLEDLLRRAVGRRIKVSTSAEPALWRIKADPAQLEQVLLNLATNARDAMPAGGKLSIAANNVELLEPLSTPCGDIAAGKYVVVTVKDTGSGMARDVLRDVFDPFFTTKRFGGGTGLGLAAAYGIVKQNGGHISVESEVGAGTTFSMYFKPSFEEAAPAIDGARAAATSGAGERVLVVEDNDLIRSLVVRMLQKAGYVVHAASNAAQGFALACSTPYALLVTDIIMPGGNGQELATRLHALYPELRILYMSGYPEGIDLNDGLGELLLKPFKVGDLLTHVRRALDKPSSPRMHPPMLDLAAQPIDAARR